MGGWLSDRTDRLLGMVIVLTTLSAALLLVVDAVPLPQIATIGVMFLSGLMLGTSREVDARDLIGIAERSMSAPIFELLKRPDELHVVEQAHLHPRFVEDSVRLMVAGTLDHYDDLSDGCFVLARQVNFETIHNHDVVAERHGAVRELRAELAGAPGAAHHITAGEWLQTR